MTENVGKTYRIVSAGPVGHRIKIEGIEGNSTLTRTMFAFGVEIPNDPIVKRPTSTVQHFITSGHWVEVPASQPNLQNVTPRTEIGREIIGRFCPNFMVQVEAMNSAAFAEIEQRMMLRFMSAFQISHANVVRRENYCDKIYLETELPSATYPFNEKLSLQFDCAHGEAERYLSLHFPGLTVNVIPDAHV